MCYYVLVCFILSVQPHNLVAQNEMFKKLIFEENSFPFGKDGRMVPIRFFGTMTKEDLALNEYVVTNQWCFPMKEGGKRLDLVLLVNGFPLVIGELKTAFRDSITSKTRKSLIKRIATLNSIIKYTEKGDIF